MLIVGGGDDNEFAPWCSISISISFQDTVGLAPHVFRVAADAYGHVREHHEDACILVTGERWVSEWGGWMGGSGG